MLTVDSALIAMFPTHRQAMLRKIRTFRKYNSSQQNFFTKIKKYNAATIKINFQLFHLQLRKTIYQW